MVFVSFYILKAICAVEIIYRKVFTLDVFEQLLKLYKNSDRIWRSSMEIITVKRSEDGISGKVGNLLHDVGNTFTLL